MHVRGRVTSESLNSGKQGSSGNHYKESDKNREKRQLADSNPGVRIHKETQNQKTL